MDSIRKLRTMSLGGTSVDIDGKVEHAIDIDGEDILTLILHKSKTDQFNEGRRKVLKSLHINLFPVRMTALWRNTTCLDAARNGAVFGSNLRTRIAALLRIAGTQCNVDGSRLGTHSLRSGGSPAMFTAGYEVEVIKRWGRCASSQFQTYIWKDHYALSSVGRGMLDSLPRQTLESGRAVGKGYQCKGQRRDFRLVDISHSMSKVLRHKAPVGIQKDGYLALGKLIDRPYMIERNVSVDDVYNIANGGGGNDKLRFQLRKLFGGKTEAIRESQGHPLRCGVDADVLPPAEDVCYVVHGASLNAAKNISRVGLSRGDRVRIHFYACNRNGNIRGYHRVRSGSQAIVIVAANAAREAGIKFYRSNNDVILPAGIDGVIPPRFIRAIRLLPSYDLLWTNEDRLWEIDRFSDDENPFDVSDTEHDKHARTATASGDVNRNESLFDSGTPNSEPEGSESIPGSEGDSDPFNEDCFAQSVLYRATPTNGDVITRTSQTDIRIPEETKRPDCTNQSSQRPIGARITPDNESISHPEHQYRERTTPYYEMSYREDPLGSIRVCLDQTKAIHL